MSLLLAFGACLLTFVVLDTAWLLLVGIGQFQALIGPIMKPEPNLLAAAAFYVIYAVGLLLLVIRPAVQQRSIGLAAANGAVLGLTSYATFDLTNLAVIKGWTLGLALLDMTWGTTLSSVAAVAGFGTATFACRT